MSSVVLILILTSQKFNYKYHFSFCSRGTNHCILNQLFPNSDNFQWKFFNLPQLNYWWWLCLSFHLFFFLWFFILFFWFLLFFGNMINDSRKIFVVNQHLLVMTPTLVSTSSPHSCTHKLIYSDQLFLIQTFPKKFYIFDQKLSIS